MGDKVDPELSGFSHYPDLLLWPPSNSRSVTTFCPLPKGSIVDYLNPSPPNISMYILHTVLNTFPKRLTRRICVTVKSCFSW